MEGVLINNRSHSFFSEKKWTNEQDGKLFFSMKRKVVVFLTLVFLFPQEDNKILQGRIRS